MTDRADHGVRDANFIALKALPASAGSTNTSGLDLGLQTARGARLGECELQIDAPALNTTQMPDSQTATYKLETAVDAAFTSAKTVADKVIVQTGAGGAGAAAAVARMKLATDWQQYIRLTVTTSASAGDCSAVSMTLTLMF